MNKVFYSYAVIGLFRLSIFAILFLVRSRSKFLCKAETAATAAAYISMWHSLS